MTSDETGVTKLLLVDDKPENLVALKGILRESGYQLLTATSGEEALKIALRERLAVMLLDVVMPGMDGFEVARTLKRLERTRDLPILFLTALATDVHQIYRAYEVGAVDYVIKPLDSEVVRKKVEMFVDLVHHREQLEREKQAAEEALRITRLREEFLAIVAHDLRTPLGSVRMGAGLLARTPENVALVEKTARRILRASERMDHLISDLVDFGLIQAERLTVEPGPVEADSLVQENLELFRPLAAEKGVRIDGSGGKDLLLSVDRDRLLQILSNLMGNAIKFTPKGGAVELRVERSGTEAVFTVSDTGRGLSAEEMSRMWGRYWQAEKRPEGGLGLGLFITRELVEAHGGRIWAEGRPGGGTRFSFTMPLSTAPTDAPLAQTRGRSTMQSLRPR